MKWCLTGTGTGILSLTGSGVRTGILCLHAAEMSWGELFFSVVVGDEKCARLLGCIYGLVPPQRFGLEPPQRFGRAGRIVPPIPPKLPETIYAQRLARRRGR